MTNQTEASIVAYLKRFGLPLKNFQKFPSAKNWQEKVWSDFTAEQTSNTTGFGVNCGRAGLVVIDLDVSDDYDGHETWASLIAQHGDVDTLTVKTANDGMHVYFKLTQEQIDTGLTIKNSVKALGAGIDIRADRGQVVAPTSVVWKDKDVHSKGKGSYEIHNAVEIAKLPTWLFAMLTTEVDSKKTNRNATPVMFSARTIEGMSEKQAQVLKSFIDEILALNSGEKHAGINRIVSKAAAFFGNDFEHLVLPQLRDAAIATGHSEASNTNQIESAWNHGLQNHTPFVPIYEATEIEVTKKKPAENEPLHPDYFYTDTYIGDAFMQISEGKFLSVFEWNGWATYEKETGLWVETPNEVVRNRFTKWYKTVLHPAVVENGNALEQRYARPYLNTNTAQSAVEYMRGEYGVKSSIFDNNKDVALMPDGNVVMLDSGVVRPATPEDRFTKSLNEVYEAGFKCEKWDTILAAFNTDVHDYLQVVIGQSLTGHQPTDSAVHFFHGGGSNGKSVFFDVINEIFGDYADTPDSNILLRSQQNNSFTKHVFKGNRVAILEELPEAQWLDAAMLKKLVGTKYMRGAQKFKDEETFENTSTIFVNTNYKPLVSDLDHGTWRRLKVIDMPYTFVKADDYTGKPNQKIRDVSLLNPADQEDIRKAALAWAIEGAVKWYENGRQELSEPESMKKSHKDWRRGQDKIDQWFDENFVIDASRFVLTSDLYDTYKIFLNENGFAKQNSKTFMDSFKQHALFSEHQLEHVVRSRKPKGKTQSFWMPEPKNEFDKPTVRDIGNSTNAYVVGIAIRGKSDSVSPSEKSENDKKFALMTAQVEDDNVEIEDF